MIPAYPLTWPEGWKRTTYRKAPKFSRYDRKLSVMDGVERVLAELDVHVHDLRHTFGRRLRAAGVSAEDRADLLGHYRGSITTHYSAAEIGHLIAAGNRVNETRAAGVLQSTSLAGVLQQKRRAGGDRP